MVSRFAEGVKVEAIDVALLLILLDTAVVLNFSKMSFELPSPAIYFSMFARYFSFLRPSLDLPRVRILAPSLLAFWSGRS